MLLEKKDIETLPQSVQNYIVYTQSIGKETVTSASLKQTGSFKINGRWAKLNSRQWFDFPHKSFSWKARIGGVRVIDQYVNGKGSLKAKVLGIFSLLSAEGEAVDQGEILRLLSEMAWFPSSLISEYIRWEEIDKHIAKATITYGDKETSAYFHFDDDGRLLVVKTKRYMELKGRYSLQNWEIGNFEYKHFNNKLIPYKGEIKWILNEIEDVYCRIEIKELKQHKLQE